MVQNAAIIPQWPEEMHKFLLSSAVKQSDRSMSKSIMWRSLILSLALHHRRQLPYPSTETDALLFFPGGWPGMPRGTREVGTTRRTAGLPRGTTEPLCPLGWHLFGGAPCRRSGR
jgi:hypothetical protein